MAGISQTLSNVIQTSMPVAAISNRNMTKCRIALLLERTIKARSSARVSVPSDRAWLNGVTTFLVIVKFS